MIATVSGIYVKWSFQTNYKNIMTIILILSSSTMWVMLIAFKKKVQRSINRVAISEARSRGEDGLPETLSGPSASTNPGFPAAPSRRSGSARGSTAARCASQSRRRRASPAEAEEEDGEEQSRRWTRAQRMQGGSRPRRAAAAATRQKAAPLASSSDAIAHSIAARAATVKNSRIMADQPTATACSA